MTKKEDKPTVMHRRLANLTVKAITKGNDKPTKKKLLKDAGFSDKQIEQRNAYNVFKGNGYNIAMLEAFESNGLTDTYASKKLKQLFEDDNPNAINNALGHYFKVKGSYAPTKTEHKEDVDIQHTINQDGGNYLEFVKQQNKDKQIIEGVIDE